MGQVDNLRPIANRPAEHHQLDGGFGGNAVAEEIYRQGKATELDRLVRSEGEFERIAQYIERNPVKAGLAATPEEFPGSSARQIDNVGNLPH